MQATSNHFYVYIFGDQSQAVVQIGIAGNLRKQLQDVPLQSAEITGKKLVYFEYYTVETMAQNRERQIKSTSPAAINTLVESMNPNWLDLSDVL